MKLLVKISFVLILTGKAAFAQEYTDSTNVETPKKKKDKKVKLLFAFDARRSFILDRRTKFNGLKIGVTVKEKYRLGLGLYSMQEPIVLPKSQVNKQEYPDASDTLLFDFNYTSVFYQPIWYTSKRWEISSPFQLGVGTIRLLYRDTTGTKDIEFLKGGLPIVTVSAVFQYKLVRWFALGTGIGYRIGLTGDSDAKKAINAPFYNFQFKLLLGEVYRMIFKKEELEEW